MINVPDLGLVILSGSVGIALIIAAWRGKRGWVFFVGFKRERWKEPIDQPGKGAIEQDQEAPHPNE